MSDRAATSFGPSEDADKIYGDQTRGAGNSESMFSGLTYGFMYFQELMTSKIRTTVRNRDIQDAEEPPSPHLRTAQRKTRKEGPVWKQCSSSRISRLHPNVFGGVEAEDGEHRPPRMRNMAPLLVSPTFWSPGMKNIDDPAAKPSVCSTHKEADSSVVSSLDRHLLDVCCPVKDSLCRSRWALTWSQVLLEDPSCLKLVFLSTVTTTFLRRRKC
ncbi:PREDICTED: uncharacterized protein LOC107096710 [Cyprinodon variegatus]|uniref:uncharacterized protein LOC107096710 n=1 Tax=Cyprinodon variegatus TaxID=28743 RepID=UPI0007426E1B|nr:PREDICTED: uncharacterized protein LOC107096710 [Cyprinodon variegatus]